MKIGVAKEIKRHEYRVGATPYCVSVYVSHGHSVMVESGAGQGTGYSNDQYSDAGATITSRDTLFRDSEMIIKVKEPLQEEYDLLHPGQILFTYLHLASDKQLAIALQAVGVRAIAYETIQENDGSLPCLTPMSEIAGRLSIHQGVKYLEKEFGGRGILLEGIPGVIKGKVVILGGGVVGINAAKVAAGIGADVTVVDISSKRLAYLDDIFSPQIHTLFSNELNINTAIVDADVVIGAVLIPGASAPKLIKKQLLISMKKGAVIVDVSIDQGGCIETSKPTTHDNPIYTVDGVIHYCVTNMPGIVPLTSTLGLTNQTLRFGLLIADSGIEDAVKASKALAKGVNTWDGHITCEAVANSLNLPFTHLPL